MTIEDARGKVDKIIEAAKAKEFDKAETLELRLMWDFVDGVKRGWLKAKPEDIATEILRLSDDEVMVVWA